MGGGEAGRRRPKLRSWVGAPWGCRREEGVRSEGGLSAVPEGQLLAVGWGLERLKHFGRTLPLRAERPFWESPWPPNRLGRQRGGCTQREDRLVPGLVEPPVSWNLPVAWRMEGSFPAPSPWGASCGCEACGVWLRAAQTLRIRCYYAVTGSYLFWGRESLDWLGLTRSFERTMVILTCDWRGRFNAYDRGGARMAASLCWVLQFLVF